MGVMCGLWGCAEPLPAASMRQTQQDIQAAREAGAYDCAGRELALAQAHYEFAQVERRHGHLDQARFHLSEAALNADAAKRLSLLPGCHAQAQSDPSAGRRRVDEDQDGVPDYRDLCLGEAEDRDGDQDADGCPE